VAHFIAGFIFLTGVIRHTSLGLHVPLKLSQEIIQKTIVKATKKSQRQNKSYFTTY